MADVKVPASEKMEAYFKTLEDGLSECIEIAKKARAEGYDPSTDVEIPIASDLADRVEALMGYTGVAKRIRELCETMSREEAEIKLGADFAAHMFGEERREDIIDHAIRAAMAIQTEGAVAAPTEGISKVGIGKNDDGTEYIKISYAGPIRSAGGTAQVISVLEGDYIRKILGMNRYIPREEEVERYVEEIKQYNSNTSLQYMPPDDDLRHIVRNCPVCIDGEPTEQYEVSGHRNLERVETNAVRGGMCLVVAEGLGLKAPKVQKIVKKIHMEGWEWLDFLVAGGSKAAAEAAAEAAAPKKEDKKDEEEEKKIHPKDKYIHDVLAGRPIFGYPMRKGGFRLRYGRSRNTGFAGGGFSPATLHILDNYLAVGTQMKVERPGKAVGVAPVDSIEGPTVRLLNGDVVRADTIEEALPIMNAVSSIIDAGETLVSFGEFLENNHPLIPPAYCHEWWEQECDHLPAPESEEQALEYCAKGYYLHPYYTYLWDDRDAESVLKLSEYFAANGRISTAAEWNIADGVKIRDDTPILAVPDNPEIKPILEELLVLHKLRNKHILIDKPRVFLRCIGLDDNLQKLPSLAGFDPNNVPHGVMSSGLSLASYLSGFKMRSKAGTRIGGRMGRPGKSMPREMKGKPHVLYPVGDEGGNRRSFQEVFKSRSSGEGGMIADQSGFIDAELGHRVCPECGAVTYKNRCDKCGAHTNPTYKCFRCGMPLKKGEICPKCGGEASSVETVRLNVRADYTAALEKLGLKDSALKLCKGVKGVSSKDKCIEPLEKGILRAMNDLLVFKDGTSRYDMIDMPLTHFRPDEIGVPWQRILELGYTHDVYGKPLESGSQVLELKCQDILVSEDCGNWLCRVANYIDELLVKLYGLEAYYKVEKKEDLVGQLLMGLAPHTSAGVLVRLIGFTKALVGYGHPFFHAAKRRNCDGDEDCVMLLLDGLINFSRSFLPTKLGGLMDAPLVLTKRIDPKEVDGECHNVDACDHYPLEMYLASLELKNPKDLVSKENRLIDNIDGRLGTPAQYEGVMFTHDTTDISAGPLVSTYIAPGKDMSDKIESQLGLGRKMRAVDEDDLAERILKTHFLRDIMGNLNAYSRQSVNCTRCSTSYRRMPIAGKCLKCGGPLKPTIYEAMVVKYLELSNQMCRDYKVSEYTKQRVEVLNLAVKSTFGEPSEKQVDLSSFM